MHILVAEDDKVSRELLRRMLESERKHTLVLASDGEEAWNHLLDPSQAFDACIMDIQMPGLDGLEVAGRIRENERLARIPIILCTATNDRASVQRAAGLSVSGYIVKPYTRNRVMDQLHKIEEARVADTGDVPGKLEDETIVCGRLGIDGETRRALLHAMLGDMREWLSQMRDPANASGMAKLLVRATGFKGACLSLGALRAAQQLSGLQGSLPSSGSPPEQALKELEKEVALLGERLGAAPVAA